MTHDADLVTRLLRLWDHIPTGEGAEAAFRALYSDPVEINGAETGISDLVARARATDRALADRSTVVLSQISTTDGTAVAFQIRARHAGPLPTPLGGVAGTGVGIELRVIDLLAVRDGRVHEIWIVADYMSTLGAAGALHLAGGDGDRSVPVRSVRADVLSATATTASGR